MTKKIKIIIYMIVLILLLTPSVFALSEQIYFKGNDSVELNTNNKEIVNISFSEKIGAISGKLNCSGDIQIVSVNGMDNWNLTYNKDNGEFIMYNVKGQDKNEIIEIEYIVKNSKEKKTFLEMENIEVTTMDYQTRQLQNITKEIKVQKNNNYIIFIVSIILGLIILVVVGLLIFKRKK